MNIFENFKNRRDELALSVGLIFIGLLIFFAFYTIHHNSEINRMVRHTHEVLRESDALISAMKDAETGQRGYLLTGKESYLAPYKEAVYVIEHTQNQLRLLTLDNAEQQARLKQVQEKVGLRLALLEETIALSRKAGLEAAMELLNTDRGKKVMDEFRGLLAEFQQQENKLLSERMQKAEASSSLSLMVQGIGGLLIISFLLMAILNVRRQKKRRQQLFEDIDTHNKGYLLHDGRQVLEEKEVVLSLVSNLQSTKDFIKRIGNKEFDAEIRGLQKEQYQLNKDNLAGALLDVRDLLRTKDQEEGIRHWASEGIARFSEIIRQNNQDLALLSNQVLQQLIKYLNANQGALYTLNDEEKGAECLELTACYAWGKKKFMTHTIGLGEGLAGQAWQESDTLYLTDVPNNYVRISSGLGEANPSSILIVPLKVNEQVLGVLEIASFQQFKKHEIEFVEKIAENIASALSSVKINERTRQLLENSQQQTEEMRAQEEEMRQNMEELEATQEEMRRQEVEIRGQLTAVNNTLASIEFDMQGHVRSANQKFQDVMGYALEEIKGRHHRMFCETAFANSAAYTELWEKLGRGEGLSGEFKRLGKDNKEIWLYASYTPVLDHNGQAVKVIKYAFEITANKMETLDLQGKMAAIDRSNALIEFTPEGKVLTANNLFLKLMKYEQSQIIGQHHAIFVPREVRESEAYQKNWEMLRAGEILEGEFEQVDQEGRKVWIRGTYTPVFDLNGKILKIVKVAQDISQEKALKEEQLQNMEEMQATQEELGQKLSENEKMKRDLDAYLKALDAAALMSESDLYGNIINVNERFCEVAKYTREEVMGKPHNILRHPDNPKELFKEMWGRLKAGKVFKGRYPNRAKDGSTYWVDATIEPVFGPDGKIEKYIGIRFDVTEQVTREKEVEKLMEELDGKVWQMKMDEEKLKEHVQNMKETQEQLGQREQEALSMKEELDARVRALDAAALMSEADIYGNITYVNSKFCEVAKYTAEEVIGKPHSILRHPDNPKELFKEMWQTIKAGEIFQGRYPNRAKDGSTYWVDATIVPVLDDHGKPVKYIGVRFDVTHEMIGKQEHELQM